MNRNKKEEERQDRKTLKRTVMVVLIIMILLYLLRSCGTGKEIQSDRPIGDFSVTDEQIQKEEVEKQKEEVPSITFAGYGEYTVTEDRPNVELKNPKGNFVDMVFELTDQETDKLIARTDKVPAGKFVYVNVMNFYKKVGVYNIKINISTYDSQTGAQMNGMNQEMQLIVK